MTVVALVAEVAVGLDESWDLLLLGTVGKGQRTLNNRVLKRSRESRRLQVDLELLNPYRNFDGW